MMRWRFVSAVGLAAMLIGASSATAPVARADDMSIPAKCRTKEAMDNDRCADILAARSVQRNKQGNQRDAKANAALKDAILGSRVRTGETVAQVLEQVSARIPFVVTGWHFVYARSGAEYAVLSYDHEKPTGETPAETARQVEDFMDYDLDPRPVMSLQNSRALGYLVWKVEGQKFLPWGSYANMLALGPQAFAWAVNDGRNGFDNSGYDESVAHDFTFFRALPAGSGKLSDAVNPDTAEKLTLYWNVVDGYTVQASNLSCPPRKVGDFLVEGEHCAEQAAAAQDVSGAVLPFKVIRAIRNHAFRDGMVQAGVSVSVEGGSPGDWLATAAYVAEHAIVGDVTFAEVSVFVPNPRGDFPPQHVKLLAKAYYAPVPSRSPRDDQWLLLGAKHAATPADVEFAELSNDLLEDPGKVTDADELAQRADSAARRVVIQKYRLPQDWKPSDGLGLDGQKHDRDHLHITGQDEGDRSMAAVLECLTSTSGNALLQGCLPRRP